VTVIAGLESRHVHSGKVRDLYRVDDELILMVASDRISAFDYVLPTRIPDKGAVLTALTLWWFDQLVDIVPNHVVTADVEDYPRDLAPYAEQLAGRSMLCRRLTMFPVECVARGYLVGSGYKDYLATGEVCGHVLPPGLLDGDRLPEPLFTPATKAELGEHDENVNREQVAATIGLEAAMDLERTTLAVYGRAATLAETRGLIVADTKLEFGRDAGGVLVLGDEVLTPDSSRLWRADAWKPGQQQPSYDKQYVRDWLVNESGWDRSSAPPALPDPVVQRTREKYVEAYERLTGEQFGTGGTAVRR
jgi:phosphoribosylaminoimidazole-succinocarboxamide synthase